MVPLFLLLKQMGLVNSYGGVIVPAMAGIFGIFLVRQYALSIPDELLEAARIDGASEFRIFALDRRAGAEADHRHAGGVHAARNLERFHVAADRPHRQGLVHVAGRAGEPFARARAGQRADDGGLGADDACRCCWCSSPCSATTCKACWREASRGDPVSPTDRRAIARGAAARALVALALARGAIGAGGRAPLRRAGAGAAATLDDFADLSSVACRCIRRRAGVDPCRRRRRWPRAAARFRSRRHGGLRARRPRAAARSARQLRDLVLRARRRAGEQFPVQADRRRAATTSGGSIVRISPFPAQWRADQDPQAPDRVRLGPDRPITRSGMRRGSSSSSPRDTAAAQDRSGSAGLRCANFPGAGDLADARRARLVRSTRRRSPAFAVDGQLGDRMAQRPGTRAQRRTSRSISDSGANSAASSCIGWTRHSRRATTCRFPTTARNGERCAASPRGQRRQRCPGAAGSREPIPAAVAARRAGRRPTASRKSRSRTRISANRPTRSSKRVARNSPRGYFPARLFRRAGLLDAGRHRWRQRQRAACRRTARSRSGRADSRSSRSSSPAAS